MCMDWGQNHRASRIVRCLAGASFKEMCLVTPSASFILLFNILDKILEHTHNPFPLDNLYIPLPGFGLYFLAGADLANVLTGASRKRDFLRFKQILCNNYTYNIKTKKWLFHTKIANSA